MVQWCSQLFQFKIFLAKRVVLWSLLMTVNVVKCLPLALSFSLVKGLGVLIR